MPATGRHLWLNSLGSSTLHEGQWDIPGSMVPELLLNCHLYQVPVPHLLVTQGPQATLENNHLFSLGNGAGAPSES